MTNLHIGRAWGGHAIEDDCPCHQAACGLVDEVSPDCDQHTGRTIRQAHSDDECPANAYLDDAKNIIGIVLDEINNKLDEEVKRLFETDEYKIAAGVRYAQSIIREMKPTSALRRGEVA